jgi:hypothetical protein
MAEREGVAAMRLSREKGERAVFNNVLARTELRLQLIGRTA